MDSQNSELTAETEAGDEPIAGTVFNARQVRLLKIAVIIMGILLVGGFAFVMSAIVYQASHLGQSEPEPVSLDRAADRPLAPEIALPVGSGTTVSGMTLDGRRMAVQLDGPNGSEIAVIDLGSGRVVSRIRLQAK
ncbi:MAG: hypothetical protein MI824_01220 [Hyphomicrobiales bacterium]|nr:hypothetical protein [Hyphomicrobiales bacterium]